MPAFQSVRTRAVLVPESFRGGCFFGVDRTIRLQPNSPAGALDDLENSRRWGRVNRPFPIFGQARIRCSKPRNSISPSRLVLAMYSIGGTLPSNRFGVSSQRIHSASVQ